MVNEKGLKSASSIGDCIFGIGIILDSFKTTGTTPDWSDVLKIVVIGSASSYANSLRGSVPKSGPIDFVSKNHFPLNSADYMGLVPK